MVCKHLRTYSNYFYLFKNVFLKISTRGSIIISIALLDVLSREPFKFLKLSSRAVFMNRNLILFVAKEKKRILSEALTEVILSAFFFSTYLVMFMLTRKKKPYISNANNKKISIFYSFLFSPCTFYNNNVHVCASVLFSFYFATSRYHICFTIHSGKSNFRGFYRTFFRIKNILRLRTIPLSVDVGEWRNRYICIVNRRVSYT